LEIAGYTEKESYGHKRFISGGLFDLFYIIGFVESEFRCSTMAPCRNRSITLFKIRKKISDLDKITYPFSKLLESFNNADKENLIELFQKQHSSEEFFWGPYRQHVLRMSQQEDEKYIAVSFWRRVFRRLSKTTNIDELEFYYSYEHFISPFDRFLLGASAIDFTKIPVITPTPPDNISDNKSTTLSSIHSMSLTNKYSPKYFKKFQKLFKYKEDFSWIKFKGKEYRFPISVSTVAQQIFEALCIAYCSGDPEIDVTPIIAKANIQSRSVSQIFRHVTGWQNLITHGTRRKTYRINISNPR
jgi:hypothetical protein